MPNQTSSIHARCDAFKTDGLYISDLRHQITMCSFCNCVLNWKKKSVVVSHFKSGSHGKNVEKQKKSNQKVSKQPSIVTSMDCAEKVQEIKEELNKSLIKACLKANIPLHKLDHPAFRKWLIENVKGGGDIVSVYWMRQRYLPKIKAEYDQDIKAMLKDKDIAIMCDETTNRKGEAVFIIMFKILPCEANAEPVIVIPAVDVLETCDGDTTCNAIIKALNKFEIKYENGKFLSSDRAPYMMKCARLLRELVNSDMIHLTCWDHKLDDDVEVFRLKLSRLNECVKKTKKFFKNTRKRRNNYMKFLKKKYKFTQAKIAKLFPLPVISRWGSWKKSVVYLTEYLDDVVEYGRTLNVKVVSVKYFKELSDEDIQILRAEAAFVKDYCGPIDDTLLLLEGSKYSTAHRLYPIIRELVVHFKILQSASSSSIKDAVPADTKKALEGIASRSKRKNAETRMKVVAEACFKLLTDFLEEDTAKAYFTACEALFSPGKMLALKSMEDSAVSKYVKKHMANIPFLSFIPFDHFLVLHSLLVDKVSDALKSKVKKGRDYCVVNDMMLSFRANHPLFAEACIKAIFVPTSNTDVERAFSGYNDILTPRRCNLLAGNAELMTCLYLSDYSDSESGPPSAGNDTDTVGEDPHIDPDDDLMEMDL